MANYAKNDTIIAGEFIFTFIQLLIGAVFCYLLVYLPVKGRKYTEGKLLSIEVQIEVIAALCLILLVYLIPPQVETGDPGYRNYLYQGVGALLMEFAGFMRASIKFANPIRQKYSYLANCAYWVGGTTICFSGTVRMLGYEGPFTEENVLIVIAIGILVATEVWFLRRNDRRFLPRHPR